MNNRFSHVCRVQGTNGSQLWDTCFAVQAFLEVSQSCKSVSFKRIFCFIMSEIVFGVVFYVKSRRRSVYD